MSAYNDLLALFKKRQSNSAKDLDETKSEYRVLNQKLDQAQLQDTIRGEFRGLHDQLSQINRKLPCTVPLPPPPLPPLPPLRRNSGNERMLNSTNRGTEPDDDDDVYIPRKASIVSDNGFTFDDDELFNNSRKLNEIAEEKEDLDRKLTECKKDLFNQQQENLILTADLEKSKRLYEEDKKQWEEENLSLRTEKNEMKTRLLEANTKQTEQMEQIEQMSVDIEKLEKKKLEEEAMEIGDKEAEYQNLVQQLANEKKQVETEKSRADSATENLARLQEQLKMLKVQLSEVAEKPDEEEKNKDEEEKNKLAEEKRSLEQRLKQADTDRKESEKDWLEKSKLSATANQKLKTGNKLLKEELDNLQAEWDLDKQHWQQEKMLLEKRHEEAVKEFNRTISDLSNKIVQLNLQHDTLLEKQDVENGNNLAKIQNLSKALEVCKTSMSAETNLMKKLVEMKPPHVNPLEISQKTIFPKPTTISPSVIKKLEKPRNQTATSLANSEAPEAQEAPDVKMDSEEAANETPIKAADEVNQSEATKMDIEDTVANLKRKPRRADRHKNKIHKTTPKNGNEAQRQDGDEDDDEDDDDEEDEEDKKKKNKRQSKQSTRRIRDQEEQQKIGHEFKVANNVLALTRKMAVPVEKIKSTYTGHTAEFWLATYCFALYSIRKNITSFKFNEIDTLLKTIKAAPVSEWFALHLAELNKFLQDIQKQEKNKKRPKNKKAAPRPWNNNKQLARTALLELAAPFAAELVAKKLCSNAKWFFLRKSPSLPIDHNDVGLCILMATMVTQGTVSFYLVKDSTSKYEFEIQTNPHSGCYRLIERFGNIAKAAVQFVDHSLEITDGFHTAKYSPTKPANFDADFELFVKRIFELDIVTKQVDNSLDNKK